MNLTVFYSSIGEGGGKGREEEEGGRGGGGSINIQVHLLCLSA